MDTRFSFGNEAVADFAPESAFFKIRAAASFGPGPELWEVRDEAMIMINSIVVRLYNMYPIHIFYITFL